MVSPWKDHLRAYPLAEWEALETKLLAQNGDGDPERASLVRYIVGGVVECPLDRQGRILLTPELRSDVNLTKEVMLTGMIDWVEIWDKAAWTAENDATRNGFDAHRASLSRLGIL